MLACKEKNSNLEVCLLMNKLLSHLSFYKTAYLSGHLDYELAESVANEVIKTVQKIKTLGMSNHEISILEELVQQVREIKLLSGKQDPWAFFKAEEISNTCLKCHSS